MIVKYPASVPMKMVVRYAVMVQLPFGIPYILESNLHSVFGNFLNGRKLVCNSNPHLSFNHPLPTGRLIE